MNNESLIERILKSVFFRRATGRAGRYVRNGASLLELIREAVNKSGGLSGQSLDVFKEQVLLLTRLVKAYVSGEYRQVPWQTLIRIVAVLVYFVSPVDFIPDFLPVLGLTDDIALMVWLFGSLRTDLDKFSRWERAGRPTKTIEVEVLG
jgi:uncharacterized membrane protein YkvA (DUF1232 family)